LAVGLLACFLATSASVAWRGRYHGWPWHQPDRVRWCGRDYDAAPRASAGAVKGLHGDGRFPPVVGRRLFIRRSESPQRRRRSGEVCGLFVYIASGGGRFREYALSGGP
jgi:hypothetical protein